MLIVRSNSQLALCVIIACESFHDEYLISLRCVCSLISLQHSLGQFAFTMACECTGCSVPGCCGSMLQACGWPVGKKKRAAMRCHWCPPPNEEDVSKGCGLPCVAEMFVAADPVQKPFREEPFPEKPLNKPLFLWHDGSFHAMPSTVPGFSIPKVRHVSGPCWQAELGNIKEHITALQTKSAPYGWSLCYWSHEAMDAEMRDCGDDALQEAYFAINPAYKAARSDLFRPWVLHKHGGMWLDLRGAPACDDKGVGLEGVTQHFNGLPPPILLCYGGQHKEKFNGEHGEMINGFMMSAPGVSVWKSVWKHTAEMVRTYPERWRSCRKPGQSEEVVDDSLAHFTVPTGMTGREGVLCLGPLSMTKVMYKYLEQRGALNECMPKSFQNFWCWNSLTPKKKSWAQMQRHLFYRKAEDAAKHTHYSQLTTPIVLLSEEVRRMQHDRVVVRVICRVEF